jgi:hypothetical protein
VTELGERIGDGERGGLELSSGEEDELSETECTVGVREIGGGSINECTGLRDVGFSVISSFWHCCGVRGGPDVEGVM